MSAPLLETRGVWQRFGGLIANSDVSISVGAGGFKLVAIAIAPQRAQPAHADGMSAGNIVAAIADHDA